MRLSTIVASVASFAVAATATVAVTTLPASTPDLPTRPCLTDEGTSSFPCYWDAGERGNGHGRSYWIDGNGDLYYLAPVS